jgi:Fe-S-cluster containining protein
MAPRPRPRPRTARQNALIRRSPLANSLKPTDRENESSQQISNKDVQVARFVAFHKELVDGLEFNVPMTDEGKLVLWRCLPNCGRCCFPSVLSVLPKQAEGMKARGAKVLELTPPTMPQLEEPRDGRRCPWLTKDMRCDAYDDRPHSCRLYPFQYTEEKKVGYIKSELSVCPGFYLADEIDAATRETWKAIAAESNDGIAFYNEKVGESMKLVSGLFETMRGQAQKDGPSAWNSSVPGTPSIASQRVMRGCPPSCRFVLRCLANGN